MDTHYTRDEVLKFGDRLPNRGLYCDRCGVYIPQFSDLSIEGTNRIQQLIVRGQRSLAMYELQSITGCSIKWAKIWVSHSGRPTPLFTGPPCPFCGQPLKTSLAKQCLHCHRSWHHEM